MGGELKGEGYRAEMMEAGVDGAKRKEKRRKGWALILKHLVR